MTHTERRARREAIARDIKDGMTVAAASTSYGLSVQTILDACKENGVSVSYKQRKCVTSDSYAVLKMLLDGKQDARIAEKFNISRQRVHLIKLAAIAGGFTELQRD